MARKKAAPSSSQAEVRAGMFAGVKAEPDADEPRLVLADWLDDHGDADDHAHAALIRAQCGQLRRMAELIDPERPGPIHGLLRSAGYHTSTLRYAFQKLTDADPAIIDLARQEVERTNRLGADELPGLAFKHIVGWHRGFAQLNLRYDRFRSRELTAFANGPGGPRVEQVALHVSPSTVATVALCSLLGEVVGLDFGGLKASGADLTTLLAAAGLDGLRRLSVDLASGIDEVAAIVRSPRRDQLTHLYLRLHQNAFGAVRALAKADFAALGVLHLVAQEVGPEGAKALAKAPFLGRLSELTLTNCGFGAAGIAALVSGPHFRCPALLALGMNRFGQLGLRSLLAASGVEDLVVLDLFTNGFGDAALGELAASPRLAGLVALFLSGNPVGPAGIEALADSPHLGRLASLDLRGCRIGEAGARALLDSRHLRRLQLTILKRDVPLDTLDALGERYYLDAS